MSFMNSTWIACVPIIAAILLLGFSGHLALLLVVLPVSVLFSYCTTREGHSSQRKI
jgi:hypothetical protein